ncbi:Protein kinase superfamily protein [Abeliophyllum distichum]|uniref:Protein kinase superfamily protein n=1 Tax=Abeliophyllum distichum TaxID=126358 RepID=A0ABD1QYX5_9LAMI
MDMSCFNFETLAGGKNFVQNFWARSFQVVMLSIGSESSHSRASSRESNKFASGRHSRIYSGVYEQRDAAIKLISQPEEDGELAALLEKQFTSEVALLFRLRHPNIITFIAACKKPLVFCIITEYYPSGSLRKYLHQQEPYSLPLNLVLKLSLDIARGMKYLHAQGILHRDLKSENLLLNEDMCVKVADFGISCLESQCGSTKGFTGTYRWMAPEMIEEKQHTKKVDVYSFGIVIWELLTALIPFDKMTPEQAAFAVCQKLINRCWSSNPDKRPHFKEIVTILERYTESLENNPEFFSSYEPPDGCTPSRCLPKCISRRSPSLRT